LFLKFINTSRGQTDEGAKRPVTRCSFLLMLQCVWCGVSWHHDYCGSKHSLIAVVRYRHITSW